MVVNRPESLRLLIVEDQRFDVMLVRRQLAGSGIAAERVDHAETLAGAIELLSAQSYDAVLLDLGLSDSDGVGAVRALRERFPPIAIIVLTGRDEESLGLEAMAAGAQEMLTKGSFDGALLARSLRYAVERQRLKGHLRQTAEEHRALFDNNPFPVLVYDRQTLRFLAVNESAVREYGYSRDEFLAMTLLDIAPPADRERILEALSSGKEFGVRTIEWRHVRKDGGVFDVETNAQSLNFRGHAARIVLARDITVRRRAIRALEQSERRFRELFQHSLGFICTHDLSGVLLSVNPAAARSLDYSPGELMGRRLAELMPEHRRRDFKAYLSRIARNGTDSGLLEVLARDGTPRIWQYHNILEDADGDSYVLGHAQDVTEQRMYQERLRELSFRDPMTGCCNRRFLSEHERQMRGDEAWGCVLFDLDHFKAINDTFGHQRGDEVLIGFADFLRRHSRPGDVIVRMGGDEFMMLLAGAGEETTAEIAGKLRADGATGAPSAFTVGWAARAANEPLESLIGRADKHLYAARAAARSHEPSA